MRIALLFTTLLLAASARAEVLTLERVVPPGAQLTYSEGGQVLRTLAVPPGRVRVTIEFTPPAGGHHHYVGRRH